MPSTKPLTERYSVGFASSAVIWTISALVPPPLRFILWAIGLTIDFITPFLAGQLAMKFAPHISHLPERMGQFVIIVLGESHFPLVVGLTAIGIGIKQVASSNQAIPLPFSDLWLICGSVSGCLFVQAILHLVAVEDSDIDPKTRRKWATYRIIYRIVIISITILGLKLLPSVLMLILAFICALQIVFDLRDHPHRRIFRLW